VRKVAERRMFTKRITESDAFLDMPSSTQMLYFHFSMNADDDGFVNNPKKIQKMCGASDDDFKLLIAKSFIILFDSGIIVIKHWKMHNYIQADRYRPTDYVEEKSMLGIKSNKAYTLDVSKMDTECIQNGYIGKVSIDKDSKDKDSKEESVGEEKAKRFYPPTLDEVKQYCEERKNNIDPMVFIDFYSSKGWMIGKNRMKDWKAAVRTWERKRKEQSKAESSVYDEWRDA
jgi:hypothetical protein